MHPADIQRALDSKTKPVGSLGRLEQLAAQIATLQGTLNPSMSTCQLIIFGADHGIAAQGVSAYPSEVTRQMVLNLLSGGAAANVIANALNIPIQIIDSGIAGDPIDHPNFLNRRIAPGTSDFSLGPAMTPDQYQLATTHGTILFPSPSQRPLQDCANEVGKAEPPSPFEAKGDASERSETAGACGRGRGARGTQPSSAPSNQPPVSEIPIPPSSTSAIKSASTTPDAICFGEIGIANTASASIIAHKILNIPLQDLVGPGTGLDDSGVQHKLAVLTKSASRTPTPLDAQTALTEYGGFEIAMMAAAIQAAAKAKRLVIIDGFIATAAAIAALDSKPSITNALVFSHRSGERGHDAMLQALNANPLLDLDMRLGEGTGSLLAWPIIKSAAAILNNMATFESAGVSTKT